MIVFVVGVIALFTLIPLFIIMGAAMYHSAKISLKESWGLYLRKSVSKALFQALAIAQKNNLSVSLEQIERHVLCGGNPIKLMNVLARNPTNQEITFQSLSAIDLAGKDVEQAITFSQTVHEIHIKNYSLGLFKVDYHASYKLGLYAVFNNPDLKDFEKKIEEKLALFASSWDSNDAIYTKKIIQTNILNTEYWGKGLNAYLINHSLDISIKS